MYITLYDRFNFDHFADLPDWKVSDKVWMKTRREQWKQIESVWLQADILSRKNLKIIRPFFLSGELDMDEFYPVFGSFSRLEFMLLCPRQEYDFLKTYYDNIQSAMSRDETLRQYDYFYSMSVRSAQGDTYQFGDNGLFGGQDELYTKIFYADVLNTEKQYDPGGQLMPRQGRPEWFFNGYLIYTVFFLLGITRYPYVREQYLDETWYASIVLNNKPYAECEDLPMFLQCIYYFDDLNEYDPLGNRKQLATRLQTMLDERPLPDELAKLWQQIKTTSGRDFTRADELKNNFLNTNETIS
jgi:hypothetical protein